MSADRFTDEKYLPPSALTPGREYALYLKALDNARDLTGKPSLHTGGIWHTESGGTVSNAGASVPLAPIHDPDIPLTERHAMMQEAARVRSLYAPPGRNEAMRQLVLKSVAVADTHAGCETDGADYAKSVIGADEAEHRAEVELGEFGESVWRLWHRVAWGMVWGAVLVSLWGVWGLRTTLAPWWFR